MFVVPVWVRVGMDRAWFQFHRAYVFVFCFECVMTQYFVRCVDLTGG